LSKYEQQLRAFDIAAIDVKKVAERVYELVETCYDNILYFNNLAEKQIKDKRIEMDRRLFEAYPAMKARGGIGGPSQDDINKTLKEYVSYVSRTKKAEVQGANVSGDLRQAIMELKDECFVLFTKILDNKKLGEELNGKRNEWIKKMQKDSNNILPSIENRDEVIAAVVDCAIATLKGYNEKKCWIKKQYSKQSSNSLVRTSTTSINKALKGTTSVNYASATQKTDNKEVVKSVPGVSAPNMATANTNVNNTSAASVDEVKKTNSATIAVTTAVSEKIAQKATKPEPTTNTTSSLSTSAVVGTALSFSSTVSSEQPTTIVPADVPHAFDANGDSRQGLLAQIRGGFQLRSTGGVVEVKPPDTSGNSVNDSLRKGLANIRRDVSDSDSDDAQGVNDFDQDFGDGDGVDNHNTPNNSPTSTL
jgi:hypothetical protein